MSEETKWYVVHTYSGYENKVKANIEKLVGNRGMEDQIVDIVVPLQEVTEEKNGKRKVVQKKVFPGYVLINMHMNDDTWYVIRNTRGVTGFVGPGSKPVPLTEREIKNMGIELVKPQLDISLDEPVKIISGPFENSVGVIKEIHPNKHTIVVMLSIFGQETPVEMDFNQVQKIL